MGMDGMTKNEYRELWATVIGIENDSEGKNALDDNELKEHANNLGLVRTFISSQTPDFDPEKGYGEPLSDDEKAIGQLVYDMP